MINTRLWNDGWVREKLNPLDRLVFIYLLTNEHTNISGIYELPISTMSFETGIEKEELNKSMLPRLEPKVFYKKGWVILINFLKHQNQRSPTVKKGIETEISLIPNEILQIAIGYGYGMDTLSHLNLNLNLNLNLKNDFTNVKSLLQIKKNMKYNPNNFEDDYEKKINYETQEEIKEKKTEGRNIIAGRLQDEFIKIAGKEIKCRPMYNKAGYVLLCRALKVMSEKDISDSFKDWFNQSKKDEDLIQITQALSSNRLNRWKVNK